MKKIAVITGGWHYGSQFYEKMVSQIVPNGWEVDYFCIGHRLPTHLSTINEKEECRKYENDNVLAKADKILYEKLLTPSSLRDLGWKFMLEENTAGDLEFFNQWSNHYNIDSYDLFFVTHDDNLILSDNLFVDLLDKKVDLYGLDVETFDSKTRKCNYKVCKNELEWLFVDHGWNSGRITPRWSFGFYTRKLISILGDRFSQFDDSKLNRKNQFDSPKNHKALNNWNAPSHQFIAFMIDNNLLEDIRYLSNTKRVSKYCIEGERGFISNAKAGGQNFYVKAATDMLEDSNIL